VNDSIVRFLRDLFFLLGAILRMGDPCTHLSRFVTRTESGRDRDSNISLPLLLGDNEITPECGNRLDSFPDFVRITDTDVELGSWWRSDPGRQYADKF
jgi:hypothetical protein